jgi:redox-sensitive bicupin YhaK (pirin superfamily)
MKSIFYSAAKRGTADYGWLKPNYYFSFAQYQDVERMNFGALRVLNDDYIAGGGKFHTHPHDNMEIVTIPFTGAIEHKDSTGGAGIIEAGDIQIMSAGSGVQHSEANASEKDPVTLFQIWLFPKVTNIEPRYNQRKFNVAGRINQWQIVVSPIEADNALWINQDARFALTDLEANQSLSYNNAFKGNGMFVVAIEGKLEINEQVLNKRDAIGIYETNSIAIKALEKSAVLVIEVPMKF